MIHLHSHMTYDCSDFPSRSLEDILSLPKVQLGCLDIAEINLLCAEGLLGAETMDISYCLRAIDQMAQRVKAKTIQAWRLFEQTPERWDYSPIVFRMFVLITTLKKEFGVRYNPAKHSIDVPLSTADAFIFGII